MAAATQIVLVGLPGAGKSTVGPIVASALGWRFLDLDAEIEHAAGRTVSEIFAADGEATFRRLEHEATQRVAKERWIVVAPGGGWMLNPANPSCLDRDALTVYLQVSPEVAAGRIGAAAASRPLLAGPDPAAAIENLRAAREATYLQANHTVSVDLLSPTTVASIIVALAGG